MITGFMYGQGSINGKVVDNAGDPLIGASVFIDGTTTGTITDVDGNFGLKTNSNNVTLVVSYIGFVTKKIDVNVNGKTDLGTIALESDAVMLSSIEVVADYAVARKTPVAFVTVEKKQIEKVLGSRDIPLMLNSTPSVYATEQGGGAGDARINVRGFNQRNVAIMINGVPVNDMENGWVYWSNWDGVADATSSIQLQRGLSAVNLATPSIGGTMNIITSPADKKMGGIAKVEYGSGKFLKTTLSANSGLINNKFAISMTGVRKVGEGIIDKTWTDAWAYYIGASLKLNNKHKLEFFALGAPQRHGQNLYKQNIAVYSKEFAENLDSYNSNGGKAFEKFKEKGRFYNQNWTDIDPGYKGKQNVDGKEFDRHSESFINSRENFYHKPQVNLNWYANWTKKLSQSTVIYYSGGKGGGTGTYGKMYRRDADGELGDDDYKFYYGSSPWKYDFNENIKMNSGAAGDYYVDKKKLTKEDKQSLGILRNSRNNQYTIGAISKLKMEWSNDFKTTVGLDMRTAKIDHFREVRDLLGGTFFKDNSDEFHPNRSLKLGDRFDYNSTNSVNWLGGFAQAEYNIGNLSSYFTFGYSTIKYDHTNHFMKDPADGNKELFIETDNISGLQVKGGLGYRLFDNFQLFGNFGYVSKVPILDAVINDNTSELIENYKNEEFVSGEMGAKYWSKDGKFTANLNVYHTTWKNRTITVSDFDFTTENEGLLVLTGMNSLHQGIELDFAYQPMKLFRFDGAASFGNWKNTDDAKATHHDYTTNTSKDFEIYIKDLKVGDAPQTQYAISGTVFPIEGLSASLAYKYYGNFYANWNATTRLFKDDRAQSWKTPNYSLLDFHLAYDLPLSGKLGVKVFGHVFNVLDQLYIMDATDNSKYNGYTFKDSEGQKVNNSHSAERAEVFFGLPRRFNVGLKVTF